MHVHLHNAADLCIPLLQVLWVTVTLRCVPSPLSSQPTISIRSLAEVLTASLPPDAVAAILAEHVADPSGHCEGCRFPTTASPVWPCRLWAIADELRRMRAG
jgi:hypothetical protein